MTRLANLLIAVAMAQLVGCSTAMVDLMSDNTLFAGIAAYKATSTIIEQYDDPQARARRIVGYTEAATKLVDSSTPVTLDGLYERVYVLVMAQVPEVDRPMAEDILLALRDRLAAEIDEFVTLTPETEVGLLHVISRIRMAAEFYA